MDKQVAITTCRQQQFEQICSLFIAWEIWDFCSFLSAWQYVTKEDSGFFQSFGHPDLMNYHSPRMTFHAHIPQEKQKQFLFAWCTTSLQCLYSFQSPINCGLTKTTPFHNLTLSHPSVLLCNADKCWTFIWDFSLENRIAQFYSLSQWLYHLWLSCPNYCLLSTEINRKYP